MLSAADPWIRWDWVASHGDVILQRLREHVELTLITLAIGLLISLPLGVICWRFRRLYPPVLGVTGVIYTIPSLALLAFLIPFTGLTTTTAVIPLVSYTLLILVRNVVAGLDAVPAEVRDSARGMGFGRARELVAIDLPLAIPAIFAGIRIAAVTTIGLITVTALIGEGGLGQLILDGLYRDFRTELVIGTQLCVVLSTVVEVGFRGIERALTPWAGRRAP
ncbi:MAG TPA: ABC transporter permease [Acidimicrobiales bacterium]|nr:ABC transporter permease [Acidimicrobiales bacterium]